ncbi:malectin domain-containing carbohydrate-binding protein [Bacteroidota bacterium]
MKNFKTQILLYYKHLLQIVAIAFLVSSCNSKTEIRKDILLNSNWISVANDSNQKEHDGFEQFDYEVEDWTKVDIPHNWDHYEGYRRMKHGNRHGYAWYRTMLDVDIIDTNKRIFLWFEGVGSYATVWLNGKKVGYHAGGRTSFTIDITEVVNFIKPNLLAVRADHPANIRDLPWVCGGCSDEWGFSEGSQPLGIFRPVHLIVTNPVRIEPFGVHIWKDTTISEKYAEINVSTEIKNYNSEPKEVILVSKLIDQKGRKVAEIKSDKVSLKNRVPSEIQQALQIDNPHLWSLEDPYLYTLESEIIENGKTIDHIKTHYGIRWISWPIGRSDSTDQFLLNGKPVFINGVGEYEHQIGGSHAFTDEQIKARVMQIKSAGFNAFRDAHQPHNLRYHEYWDKMGILWWPQMAAHIWFDNPDFKENFKNLLKDFVKERRNSPSIILWGLENESTLPADFAKECVEIIRELDPTSSSQRKVTTCNGGTGTDWNVIQNWSGTYGGDPYNYANEISEQLLNGEYGAWRSIDLHTEGSFDQNGIKSENRMVDLMEMKVRLAESVKDKCCGQFQWLLSSHDNPGRIQNGEGLRDIDRIGPVNYKGLLTPWGEPLDVYYMYRANYVPAEEEPMVYIVSHTWPNRWTTPGIKNNIVVYSNCDKVELFNDLNANSLGIQIRDGIGTHFRWDSIEIKYNVLYAIGYINEKKVAEDIIILNHFPESPNFTKIINNKSVLKPKNELNYIYRVNCGGPDYTDTFGNLWKADRNRTSDTTWGSKSWTNDFGIIPQFYASQRRTFDPIKETNDWEIFQTFRYGRDKLSFEFPVEDGEYIIELYFIEPWYGTGGGLNCEGWRLFDIALNEKTIIENLDIWKEAGHDRAFKKEFKFNVTGGEIVISFPKTVSGQAIISAIAIVSENPEASPAQPSESIIQNLKLIENNQWSVKTWMEIVDRQYADKNICLRNLPPNFYGCEWIQTSLKSSNSENNNHAQFTLNAESDVFIALDERIVELPGWLKSYADTKTTMESDEDESRLFKVYGKRFPKGSVINLGNNGKIADESTSMYTVVVCPVSNLDAAADQRPAKRYEAEYAKLNGKDLNKTLLAEKEYIEYSKASTNFIEWEIYVGLASKYSLKFKFINNNQDLIPMQMQVISSDGIKLCDDIIEFKSRPNKWQTLKATTCTSINAGTYKVRLINMNNRNIGIDALEVQ